MLSHPSVSCFFYSTAIIWIGAVAVQLNVRQPTEMLLSMMKMAEVHGALLKYDEAAAVLPKRVVHRLLEAKHSLLLYRWRVIIQVLQHYKLHVDLKLFAPGKRPAGEPRPPVFGQGDF